ncbi:hypothetical protein DTL42_02300 [Bremerella cremea]|uniref:Uncharacterized protein n=1 Tax=Bremerella cremea TaxID=1031537 RepID=A0A368KUC9_9BACT|nr:hypothetical protein [Bremerella cremea]RCS54008.1 hypothetical protein DTL42_02300 [Bremerella cremea]
MDDHADQGWLWKDRRVLAYYASTVSMPNTVDNQQPIHNLIRTIIAQAASRKKIELRTISFKRTVQTLEAFKQVMATKCQQSIHPSHFFEQLLEAVATHRVADRPGRFEPRQRL